MFKLGTSSNGNSHKTSRLPQTVEADDGTASKLQDATQVVNGVIDQVGKTIASHPEICLATALTCGVVIGWLIKRTD